jgi:hypothetical protein
MADKPLRIEARVQRRNAEGMTVTAGKSYIAINGLEPQGIQEPNVTFIDDRGRLVNCHASRFIILDDITCTVNHTKS